MNISNNLITQAGELLNEIKPVLDVTWDDDITNGKIKNIIADGMALINDDVKAEIDYSEDRLALKLLKTYCRYAWNNSEEYFIKNNVSDIIKLEALYGKEETENS